MSDSQAQPQPPAQPPRDKIPKPEKIRAVVDLIISGKFNCEGQKFTRVKTSTGAGFPVIMSDDSVATLIDLDFFMSVIAKQLDYANIKFVPSLKDLKEIYGLWMVYADGIDEPKPFREYSSNDPVFTDLGFKLVGNENCPPVFAEFLSRCSEPDGIAEYIGSLFDLDSKITQYLWLYGDGGNGKSELGRFLDKLLGSVCRQTTTPTKDDKFWNSKLVGKRLVIFPDCNTFGFLTTGKFKSMTGGDAVEIEEKFKGVFSYYPTAKYFFHSNNKPQISSQDSDVRRCVLSEITKLTCEPDPDYHDKLWAEREQIVQFCISKYRATGKNYVVHTGIEGYRSAREEQFLAIFEHYFRTESVQACAGIEQPVSAQRMNVILKESGLPRSIDQADWAEWVCRHAGVHKFRTRISGKQVTVYKGLYEVFQKDD